MSLTKEEEFEGRAYSVFETLVKEFQLLHVEKAYKILTDALKEEVEIALVCRECGAPVNQCSRCGLISVEQAQQHHSKL